MLDKNVGDALLKLDLSPHTDPPTDQIERIIDADHRRVRRWTRISIALWIIAALGAIFIFVMGGLAFPLIAKLMMEEKAVTAEVAAKAERSGAVEAANDERGPLDNPNTPFAVLAKLVAMCMVFGTASFMVLVFAGLGDGATAAPLAECDATANQCELLQISEQLKRPAAGTRQ